MNDLQKAELNELEGTDLRGQYVITDLSGLNWAFRKIQALNAAINDVEQLADAERQRIDEYEKKETSKYKDDLSFFEHKVREYHENELLKDSKLKSIKTPYGTAKSVTKKASAELKDNEALLNYAKANVKELVETKVEEKVKWSDLKKLLTVVEVDDGYVVVDEYGTIVPGVSVKPEYTTFTLEVK